MQTGREELKEHKERERAEGVEQRAESREGKVRACRTSKSSRKEVARTRNTGRGMTERLEPKRRGPVISLGVLPTGQWRAWE